MATAIVYNQFNYKAVITAAIIANEVYVDAIYDLNNIIPDNGFDKLILVGMDTLSGQAEFYGFNKNQERIFISDLDYGDVKVLRHERHSKNNIGIVPMEPSVDDLTDHIVNGYPTMIEKAAKALEFDMVNYSLVNLHLNSFHNKNTDVKYLAFIYENILVADKAIKSKNVYEVPSLFSVDVDKYLEDVKSVKISLNDQYRTTAISDKSKRKRYVVVSTFTGFDFHLVLRLIKLVHNNFMNIALGLNGPMVFTNLHNAPHLDLKENAIVLN